MTLSRSTLTITSSIRVRGSPLQSRGVVVGACHTLARSGQIAWPLTRRLLDENPRQDRPRRQFARFPCDGGEVSDTTHFETSLDLGPDIAPRVAITDKGYDCRTNREAARARGITPVIARRETSNERGRFFPKRLYKLWARIEQTMGKLKRFKRVALRCDKTRASFTALTSFASCVMLIKSVHTA
jgi:transposase